MSPCHFSLLAEIPGSKELLENSLTYEGVQWRKGLQCLLDQGRLLGLIPLDVFLFF